MDSSEYLRLQLSNTAQFIRRNPPSQDSSTNTWKKQLNAAGGTQNTQGIPPQASYLTTQCPRPEEVSNRYTATTVGANSDYYNIMLYKAGAQTCGCGNSSNTSLFQYISSANIATPLNPILGQNPAGVQNCQVVPRATQFSNACCPGKNMVYPSG